MRFADFIPTWLDTFLIWPFRLPADALAGFWLGCALLAAYTVVLGEAVAAVLYWLNRRYYTGLDDEMIKAHNLSVAALHAGDKQSYLAVNKEAHERFGKSFFAGITVGIASLWPVPFAMAWLSLRFEGLGLFSVPFMERPVEYAFVFIILYIPERLLFSRIKKHLPGFQLIEAHRQRVREARPPMRSFFS